MRLSNFLTEKLFNDNIISKQEKEIVRYGLDNLGSNLLGLLFVVFIGCYFGNYYTGFLFCLVLFPLRKNTGGYHADTRGKCFLLSALQVIAAFVCLYKYQWTNTVYIVITTFFAILIFMTVPVDNQSKALDMTEKRVYRRRARVILIIEEIMFVLSLLLEWNELMIILTMSFTIIGVSLMLGILKNALVNTFKNRTS